MEASVGLSIKKEMTELEAQISILTKSLPDIDINQDTCPFCGALQYPPKEEVFARHNAYRHCNCDGMQSYKHKLRALNDMKIRSSDLSKLFEQHKEKAYAQLIKTGIGRRFINATFESYGRDGDMHAYEIAYEYARNFVKNDGENIILMGCVGSGKTHLAAAIANYLVEEFACMVEFYNYSEVLAEIRAAFSDEDKEQNLERKMCDADVLVIDDLGKEKSTVFSNEILYRVINYRYKEKLPIIVTTNADLKSLYERLDQAVFSRLVCICKAVIMQGTDYRLKKYAL